MLCLKNRRYSIAQRIHSTSKRDVFINLKFFWFSAFTKCNNPQCFSTQCLPLPTTQFPLPWKTLSMEVGNSAINTTTTVFQNATSCSDDEHVLEHSFANMTEWCKDIILRWISIEQAQRRRWILELSPTFRSPCLCPSTMMTLSNR